jgi:transposase
MIREATPIVLMDEDKKTLEIWVRSSKTEQRIALRARTILAAAKGMSTRAIARVQKVRPATVSKWRMRFAPTLLTRRSLPRKRESRND